MNVRIRSTVFALLAILSLGVPAFTHAAPKEPAVKPFPQIALEKRMRGEQAIQALKDRLPEVAAWYGMTPNQFAKMLRQDKHAWLDQDARLHYVDAFPPPPEQADAVTAADAPTTASASLDQTFALHSRPGARRVMYLDFDGALVSNTAWNSSYGMSVIDAKPFDLDGNPSAFSDTELQRIQNIWRRVAEDYAPFDVDVTTEEPLADAIARSGSGDLDYGTRVLVTRDWTKLTSSPCGCGGVAYVGVFNYTSETYKPAWVFFDNLGSGNEKYVAEAISHEAGHNLGLSHDGNSTVGYYSGHGSGATGWAPIMGVGYYKELTQWSKGEYVDANQTQDDLQVIQNYGGTLRIDDHGDAMAAATPLAIAGTSASGSGVVSTRADVDVFSFYTGGGTVSLIVVPSSIGANLDIAAALYDAAGTQLAYSNPTDALNASLSLSVPAGTYYLAVDGTGKGDASTGYTDYASLGEYGISGTVPPGDLGNPPDAVAGVNATSGTAPLTVTFSSAGSSDPDGDTLTYRWNFGDGSAESTAANPSHTYTAAGNYTATLTVTDAKGNQSQDQVSVSVQAAPVAVRVDSIVMAATSTKTGTKATATVKVTDSTGKIIPGATVTGVWSGVVSGTVSGSTGAKGTVKFTSPSTKTAGTFIFSVTGISAAGYSYDQNKNLETSDSITR